VRERISCVHVHACGGLSFWRGGVLALAARILRRGTVLHLHGVRFDAFLAELGAVRSTAARIVLSGADAVVVAGRARRNVIRGFCPRARVVAVSNEVGRSTRDTAAATRIARLHRGRGSR
jgi:hypothetical protein